MNDVVCRLTLGQIETLIGRPALETSANDRNEVMHSNLYLTQEARLGRAKRLARNQARLAKALQHLRLALQQFAGRTLVERDGELRAT